MAKTKKLDRDERQDIAIVITNKLIELGYVPDCTDTDDESEFEVQDMIAEVLKENKLRVKMSADEERSCFNVRSGAFSRGNKIRYVGMTSMLLSTMSD